MSPRDADHWQVDRKIPLALIGAVLLQTAGVAWWASGTSARLDQLERDRPALASQAERIVRLEEKIGGIQSGIAEIKAMIRPAAAPIAVQRPTDPG